ESVASTLIWRKGSHGGHRVRCAPNRAARASLRRWRPRSGRRYKAKVFHGEAGAGPWAERAPRRHWVAKEHHQLGDECRGEIQQHGDGTLAERGDGACAQAKILSHQ